LDEARTQQYYIATKASPADDRARVLKYGRTFSVFDHLGDIQASGLGEQGIFFQGTRHLSELILCLWNARPFLLSSAIKTDNCLFTADLTNLEVSHLDRVVIPRGTLQLQRSKFLRHDVCYEEFTFINYGLSALVVPFSMRYSADFADIFEVRGMHRPKKGRRLDDHVGKDLVLLSYEGLDNKIRQTCFIPIQSPKLSRRRNCSSKCISSPARRQSFI
jgi:glycogen debranching enzyme